ncbi:hypothetical protein [Salirhabdus salicampi]|uniref:hypothetical protein n=1 Tax=Salirhabdus salicampi TaxID=476102 RepID=UPI0020C50EDB|nr:hypothetical protein [Salirhabdus salicampi]MCP8616332.1 hypothetical protein [Salirhabdus salicampi]
MSKRTVIGTLVIMAFIGLYLVYQNHQQLPTENDVLKQLGNWSKPVNILTIEKIDGEWITFFRDSEQLYVGFLKQNWLGQWNLNESLDKGGVIGETPIQPIPEERAGIIWGVSGLSKGDDQLFRLYYGMILNSEIDKITLSVGNEIPKNVPMFKSEGKRFFLIKKEKKDTVPYKLRAYSKGEVIAHES